MRLPRWSLPLATLGVMSCGPDSMSPGVRALHGRWLQGPEALQPQGSMMEEFIVYSDGRTENRIVMLGLYPGQTPSERSAVQVLHGRIAVQEDRFVVHPDSEVTNDRFYGPGHHVVRTRDIAWWVTDTVQFEVRGSLLMLRFLTYPADAPVPATAVYRRDR
jgi:hypothetical protein